MEQLAARWAHNPKVGGSSPSPATKKELLQNVITLFIYNFINNFYSIFIIGLIIFNLFNWIIN